MWVYPQFPVCAGNLVGPISCRIAPTPPVTALRVSLPRPRRELLRLVVADPFVLTRCHGCLYGGRRGNRETGHPAALRFNLPCVHPRRQYCTQPANADSCRHGGAVDHVRAR